MKLLFSIATVFMFLGFTVGSYGRATVYVSSTQTEPLAVGEQMHLNIQIVGGKSVSGYELTVGFDPTALRYIEGANADYLPADAFTIPPIVTENAVYMTATSGVEVALAREGTLATLTFEVVAAKGSIIKLMDVILSDSAGMPLPVTSQSGQIVTIVLPPNWDVNEDGRVNILDLTLVASNLNANAPENPRVDVNKDGNVNILDLVLVAQNLDAAGGNEPEVRVKLVVPTVDNTAPTVTGGTVFDGDEDVDSEAINSDGEIEITFSEEVSGNIALQTEGGDDVGWFGKVEGNKGTLELVKGKEIGNETTYVIAGKVADATGNETEVSITFTTKGKE